MILLLIRAIKKINNDCLRLNNFKSRTLHITDMEDQISSRVSREAAPKRIRYPRVFRMSLKL